MSKMYFRYGAMDSGKSFRLMTVAHDYESKDKVVRVIKSIKDSKGKDKITSRIGLERKVDIIIGIDESFEKYYEDWNNNVHCLLVDEAQFLSAKQIEELWLVSKMYDIPVICYGLRTNLRSESFEGSKRLMELADVIEEIPNICECGRKAKFNARFVNGEFTLEGDEVVIDDKKNPNTDYKSMCPRCYIKMKYNK